MSQSKVQQQLTYLMLDIDKCVNDSLFATDEMKEYIDSKVNTTKNSSKTEIKVQGNNLMITNEKGIKRQKIKEFCKKFIYAKQLNSWISLTSAGDTIKLVYVNVEEDEE